MISRTSLSLIAALIAVQAGSLPAWAQHAAVTEKQVHRFPRITVPVDDFPAQGWILDVGAGGAGVIGVLKGAQVVGIDIIKQELIDAAPGPLKIVMDARDLKFLDNTFNTATAFFVFMYIKDEDHPRVFQEVHRVLAAGGKLRIWDAVFPKPVDPEKTHGLFTLNVQLPKQRIDVGYGVRWPAEGRPLSRYEQLARAAGFTVVTSSEKSPWFYLELQK
jgi:SAM-dependent methyltransferase